MDKILRSLPQPYDTLVPIIQECKDLSTYSIEELTVSILNHEYRLQKRNENL